MNMPTRHVDLEYDNIRQLLLKMGGLVEQAMVRSMRALGERDSELAHEVIAADREVDETEKKIDSAVMNLLARQQPAAVDLRFLVAVMKINTDLERIGDLAANICRSARELNNEVPLEESVDLPQLAEEVRGMVQESLDAFVKRDAGLAITVWKRDDEVDSLYRFLFKQLVKVMGEKPDAVNRALPLLIIARNLERIADHATNIAEDVIYYVEGRDIRHEATDYDQNEEDA